MKIQKHVNVLLQMGYLLAFVLSAVELHASIDTVRNIGSSSIFGSIVVSRDASKFIAVDLGLSHSIRSFDDPFVVQNYLVTGTVVGSSKECVPVGFLNSGEVTFPPFD